MKKIIKNLFLGLFFIGSTFTLSAGPEDKTKGAGKPLTPNKNGRTIASRIAVPIPRDETLQDEAEALLQTYAQRYMISLDWQNFVPEVAEGIRVKWQGITFRDNPAALSQAFHAVVLIIEESFRRVPQAAAQDFLSVRHLPAATSDDDKEKYAQIRAGIVRILAKRLLDGLVAAQ